MKNSSTDLIVDWTSEECSVVMGWWVGTGNDRVQCQCLEIHFAKLSGISDEGMYSFFAMKFVHFPEKYIYLRAICVYIWEVHPWASLYPWETAYEARRYR